MQAYVAIGANSGFKLSEAVLIYRAGGEGAFASLHQIKQADDGVPYLAPGEPLVVFGTQTDGVFDVTHCQSPKTVSEQRSAHSLRAGSGWQRRVGSGDFIYDFTILYIRQYASTMVIALD
jgi:hypothetical protein